MTFDRKQFTNRLVQMAITAAESWEARAAVIADDPKEKPNFDRMLENARRLRAMANRWEKHEPH